MKLNQRRLQFSLRGLLIFVTLASVLMAWFGARWRAAKQQRDAVAAIRALGGGVVYDYQDRAWRSDRPDPGPPGPAWARKLLGVDFFADVVGVGRRIVMLRGQQPITDAWLEPIGKLTRLEALDLEWCLVTDAGLEKLEGLARLRKLNLSHTRITDAGLAHVGKLTGLESLSLEMNLIVGGGVKNLEGLTRLRTLDASNTWLTDADMEPIGKLTSLEVLTVGGGRPVTDAGVAKLEGLTRLRELRVEWSSAITDAGLAHVGKLTRLEVLTFQGETVAGITDAGLEHLKGLTHLCTLHLGVCRVTPAGMAKLQRALPHCEISYGNEFDEVR